MQICMCRGLEPACTLCKMVYTVKEFLGSKYRNIPNEIQLIESDWNISEGHNNFVYSGYIMEAWHHKKCLPAFSVSIGSTNRHPIERGWLSWLQYHYNWFTSLLFFFFQISYYDVTADFVLTFKGNINKDSGERNTFLTNCDQAGFKIEYQPSDVSCYL